MALEVIGGIASIAQLAGTVYTLSKTLYEVSESLSNASAEITDLARDLETFAEELNLLSTLLHGKDGRYADRIYRLTAKIIGDCATICLKIDRIVRKSRRGSVWGKVKWLYKEKEILKLLARLRDLKLSLMSTLSVLSALRADYMMDSLGIQHASLLGGPKDQSISDETMKEVEETKAKLASISLKSNPSICTYKPTTKANPSKPSSHAGGSSSTLASSSITPTSSTSTAYGSIGHLGTGVPPFMSNVLMPGSIPMQNLRALESVDSFHSAISHLDDDDGRSPALAGEARGAAPASCVKSASLIPASYRPQNFISQNIRNFSSGGENTATVASASSAFQADPVLVSLMAGGRQLDIARNAGDKALPSDEEDEAGPTQNLPDPDPSRPIFLQAQNVAVGDNDRSNDSIAKQQEAVTVWREETIISAIKNIGMAREDAEAWVMSLPLPAAKEILSQPHRLSPMPNPSLTPSVAPLRQSETYPGVSRYQTIPEMTTLHFPRSQSELFSQNAEFLSMRRRSPPYYKIGQSGEFFSTPCNQITRETNAFNAIETTADSNIQTPQAAVRDSPSHSSILNLSHSSNNMQFITPSGISASSSSSPPSVANSHPDSPWLDPERPRMTYSPTSSTVLKAQFSGSATVPKHGYQQFQQRTQQRPVQPPQQEPLQPPQQQPQQQQQLLHQMQAVPVQSVAMQTQPGAKGDTRVGDGPLGDLRQQHVQPVIRNMSVIRPQMNMAQDEYTPWQSFAQSPSYGPTTSESTMMQTMAPLGPNSRTSEAWKKPDSTNIPPLRLRESGSNDLNMGFDELQAFRGIRPPMSVVHAESSPASNSVGELWLKALRTLELDGNGAAKFLKACLDTNGVCYGDSYRTNPPHKIEPWADAYEQRLTILCDRLPGAETPIQQIFRILNVMKQTLGFESGIIVWPCLTTAAEHMLLLIHAFSGQEKLDNLACLAEIATIVARYTVMESIYSNWKGMSLEKEYESALIELSTHVLRYIGLMLEFSLRREGRSDMKGYFDEIRRADAKCRGFSAVISTDDTHDRREVEVEDVSEDSDSTLDIADNERDCKRKREVESEGDRKRQKILDAQSYQKLLAKECYGMEC